MARSKEVMDSLVYDSVTGEYVKIGIVCSRQLYSCSLSTSHRLQSFWFVHDTSLFEDRHMVCRLNFALLGLESVESSADFTSERPRGNIQLEDYVSHDFNINIYTQRLTPICNCC